MLSNVGAGEECSENRWGVDIKDAYVAERSRKIILKRIQALDPGRQSKSDFRKFGLLIMISDYPTSSLLHQKNSSGLFLSERFPKPCGERPDLYNDNHYMFFRTLSACTTRRSWMDDILDSKYHGINATRRGMSAGD